MPRKTTEPEPEVLVSEEYIPRRRFWPRALVLLVILLFIIWLSGLLPLRLSRGFQAVFLNNGQVYFGKMYASPSQFAVLKDVYYLQVTQPLQNGQNSPGNVNLVKLGGELHGPTDQMHINRQNILFTEDLRSDSRVVQAITQLEKK